MFDKFGDAAVEVLFDAYGNSRRFKSDQVCSEHILASLANDQESIAAGALGAVNINSENLVAELERSLLIGKQKDITTHPFEVCTVDIEEMKFSFPAKQLIKRAREIRLFFGHSRVEPEHLLLAMIDIKDESAMKVLEELGANITYMNRFIVSQLAERDSIDYDTQSLRQSVLAGIDELVDEKVAALEELEQLSTLTEISIPDLPQRSEIAHLMFTAFLPDFLFIQVGFQRYLLEETIKLLRRRAGNIDPEFVASTVSTAAQNLRADVRHSLEHIWSQEFRLLSLAPAEADYDSIGSIIEDLWWTHSEEIALNQVFDNAMDDHRRQQMLELQKRRLEISERFVKLRERLSGTIKQCFSKRVSA